MRVDTDAGIDGLGESTWGYFAPDAVPTMVEYFKPVLLGKDPMEITQLTRALTDDSVWWARSGAERSVISGIELALWDLMVELFAKNLRRYQQGATLLNPVSHRLGY